MAIVRCPRCRDEVTVPPAATSRALVRCPLCLEEYLLSEALANAPPLLVIIGGEVPQAAINSSPIPGHDYQLASHTLTASPENHWGHAAATTLAPRAPTVRTGPRARKREPNIALLLVSWVGGGVLGLALAPLVLWWIFKVDPVELGPTVSAYAPWAVPQQFHGSPPPVSMDSEPVARPTKRRPKKATAENEPEPERSASTNDLQTLPSLDEPATVATPAIDAPNLTEHQTKRPQQPTDNKPDASSEPTAPRPPIPDLTDLLP